MLIQVCSYVVCWFKLCVTCWFKCVAVMLAGSSWKAVCLLLVQVYCRSNRALFFASCTPMEPLSGTIGQAPYHHARARAQLPAIGKTPGRFKRVAMMLESGVLLAVSSVLLSLLIETVLLPDLCVLLCCLQSSAHFVCCAVPNLWVKKLVQNQQTHAPRRLAFFGINKPFQWLKIANYKPWQ